MSIRAFVDEHYRHFNAGTVARASASLVDHLAEGGRIFLTLAGAMSTAEIGRTLADMIRAGHIAAISSHRRPPGRQPSPRRTSVGRLWGCCQPPPRVGLAGWVGL